MSLILSDRKLQGNITYVYKNFVKYKLYILELCYNIDICILYRINYIISLVRY